MLGVLRDLRANPGHACRARRIGGSQETAKGSVAPANLFVKSGPATGFHPSWLGTEICLKANFWAMEAVSTFFDCLRNQEKALPDPAPRRAGCQRQASQIR